MKMKNIAVIIGIAVVALAGASVTVTQQNEYKLIRQFGKVDRVISLASALRFHLSKAPSRFPKRPCCTIWLHLT